MGVIIPLCVSGSHALDPRRDYQNYHDYHNFQMQRRSYILTHATAKPIMKIRACMEASKQIQAVNIRTISRPPPSFREHMHFGAL